MLGRFEEEWIAFATREGLRKLSIEVKDALGKNRDRPLGQQYGLPNLTTELRVELTLSEREVVRRAFAKAAEEAADSLGGGHVDQKGVLLYLSELILQSEPGKCLEREDRSDPHHTVLYHTCEECQRARMATSDGFVEADSEDLARVEGDAEAVRIDPTEE